MLNYIKELLPKMMRYRLARRGLAGAGMPINLTFSVTNVCHSRCKTCSIWELYRENPQKRRQELTLEEIMDHFGFSAAVRGDANNNDALDISDAIYTLSYLFASGPAPVPESCFVER